VRDPAVFFEVLAAHGIEHPPVRANAPADTDGWLLKDARGCGGWHIRHAHTPGAAASASAWHYFQRQVPGVPMSATFIANGERASVLGLNELIVRPFGAHPHVYCGCIGPVAASADLAQRIGEVVELLTAAFGLRGWCSLDFILGSDDSIAVLEVNPRPPASLLLYAQPGLMDAQLRACLQGELPAPAAFALRHVRGSEIVYARHPLRIDERGARYLAGRPDAHDLPLAGSCFDAGDPICSLSAAGDTAEHVRALLLAARDAVMHTLERPS
jgi:predicted ATP-grasp superfamily ATP-dependent carboligase